MIKFLALNPHTITVHVQHLKPESILRFSEQIQSIALPNKPYDGTYVPHRDGTYTAYFIEIYFEKGEHSFYFKSKDEADTALNAILEGVYPKQTKGDT